MIYKQFPPAESYETSIKYHQHGEQGKKFRKQDDERMKTCEEKIAFTQRTHLQ